MGRVLSMHFMGGERGGVPVWNRWVGCGKQVDRWIPNIVNVMIEVDGVCKPTQNWWDATFWSIGWRGASEYELFFLIIFKHSWLDNVECPLPCWIKRLVNECPGSPGRKDSHSIRKIWYMSYPNVRLRTFAVAEGNYTLLVSVAGVARLLLIKQSLDG